MSAVGRDKVYCFRLDLTVAAYIHLADTPANAEGFNILFSRRGAENAEVTCDFLQRMYWNIHLSLRSLRLCESKSL